MSDLDCRVLVVFVDALGPSQLDRLGERLSGMPHRRVLRGILGYSSGALPTLLTGAPPTAHGRMCLFSRRVGGSDNVLAPLSLLGFLPRVLHERGPLRRAAATLLSRFAGLSGYLSLHRVPPEAFSWLDIPEREDMFQSDSIGDSRTFLADARAAGLTVFAARWQLPEQERWAEAFAALAQEKPDLSFLYTAEIDASLHAHGNHSPQTDEVFARLATRINRARDLLSQGGRKLTTIVVGDHGMADVIRAVDPRPLLARLHVEHAFVDSTMLRLWGGSSDLSRARDELSSAGTPGVFLDSEALSARQAPMRGAPFAQAMWLLPEGMIFAPSWVGGRARGMHGYDIGTPSSFAALGSDSTAMTNCHALTDVAAVLRRVLGLDGAQRRCA